MEIINLLKKPLDLKEDKLFLIQNELEKYPYFQPLHLLQVKALKNGDKTIFNASLEKASTFCSNRKILFDYLYYKNSPEDKNKKIEEETIIEPKKLQENSIPLETPSTTEVKEDKIAENSPPKKLKEAHSFSQWLKSGKTSSSESEEILEQKKSLDDKFHIISNEKDFNNNFEKESIEEKFKIINEFLEKNPKIVPVKEYKTPSTLPQTGEGMSHLMTETLAKIYVEQKKYDKAIKAYNILRLKYPEKSGFFADQIKFIKELKNN
ncbi:hypothetical protein KRX57_04465 [Weeksellaceae bacterium TAE3-ERU29]|nr:hypothetical protein [Weeksellaceae bacterium TAE3-ERU29]